VTDAGGDFAQEINAKFKMQNANATRVRENGVKVAATFTPMA
jgi:hypothetical protein